MRTKLFSIILLAVTAVSGCKPQAAELDSKGISPSPSFTYADTLSGTIVRSTTPKDIGEQITFSGSGGTSPMKILGETDGIITIQLFTGHSIDTFIIDKKTGLFSRSYSGTSSGPYAGAAIGTCK